MRRVGRVLTAVALVAGISLMGGPVHGATTDGKIAFGRFDADIGDFDIFTANPDGSDMTEILPGPAECPRWSADGSSIQVCVVSPAGLIRPAIAGADGSNLTLVPVSDQSLNLGCWAWSSTGLLACEGWDDAHPNRAPGVFALRSSDGGGLRRLTTNTAGTHDIAGDFSPGGGRFVFMRGADPDAETGTLYVMNTNGTGLHSISPKGFAQDFGSWSPDGEWILFTSTRAKLFGVHPDGTGLHQIPIDTPGRVFVSQPAWSPDGSRILARVYRTSDGLLRWYTMTATGTDLQPVEGTQGDDEFGDWGVATG